MIQRLLAAAVMLFAVQINAGERQVSIFELNTFQNLVRSQVVEGKALDWIVGETADYKINMGFLSGTMKTQVREEVREGFWVQQDMSIMGQQQKVEMLIDRSTGEILELIVNGKKEEIPEPGNQEIVDMQDTTVTVPAGSFECLYLKIRDLDENKDMEAWINPYDVPVTGMIKQKAPGPFGTVTVELTAFRKL